MLDKKDEDDIATYGLAHVAFRDAERWLEQWRHDHPEDDRSDYALIMNEYAT